MINAAEQLMVEEGYAAVTSRRVASKAGLKPQLVHYYFSTMDDLFLAILERGTALNSVRLARALASDEPLQALWSLSVDTRSAAITSEFVALANHRKAIRTHIAKYAKQTRAFQVKTMARVLDEKGIDRKVWPAEALALMLDGIARVLMVEASLGMSKGHAQTTAIVRRQLQRLSGARKTSRKKRSRA